MRFASTRSICPASTRTGGESRVELDDDPVGVRARPRRAPGRRARPPTTARDAARRAPASSRETSRRFATTRSSRAASPRIGCDERGAVALVELDLVARERVRARDDGGQRRAQIVRDRAQQRGLDGVAAAQRLRLERFAPRAAARSTATREQRRERREESLRDRRDRAHRARRRAAWRRRAQADLDGDRVLPGAGLASPSSMRAARTPSAPAARSRELVELGGEVGAAQQVAGRLGQDVASRRRCSASSCATRARAASALTTTAVTRYTASTAQFAPSRELERVRRRQEEPVEGEHARDRDDRGEHRSPSARRREHGEHVEDAEAEHRQCGRSAATASETSVTDPAPTSSPTASSVRCSRRRRMRTTVEDAARRRASARPSRSGRSSAAR